MTDKELRKLSRLELLELLLEVSNENKMLSEKIDKLKAENKTAESIENLSVVTRQVENALKYAESLTDTLKNVSGTSAVKNSSANKEDPVKQAVLTDREIYRRILCFFAENDEKLSVFPEELENDVRQRIRSILRSRNTD